MIDLFLLLTAIANGSNDAGQAQAGAAPRPTASASSSTHQPAPATAPALTAAPDATPQYRAESQVPTGRFTTATEVRPILDATRANWVAVREYDGKDLVYLTHLLSWRCGLVAIHVSLNGGPLEAWPMEACHEDTNAPNALTGDATAIYRGYPLGSVETITVGITYDDLTADTATFDRKGAMIR
ncbi:hypothetical protein ACN2XU_18245 [Primorskyibacter sp. 2E107]|uniref:hypothetical protein n=1 Tax=Primorskyibacter sp. 2E107 TaxID=3403458 RepID=UPI003AF7175B